MSLVGLMRNLSMFSTSEIPCTLAYHSESDITGCDLHFEKINSEKQRNWRTNDFSKLFCPIGLANDLLQGEVSYSYRV